MNLIILTDQDLSNGSDYKLSDHRAEHIRSILKLEQGDSVEIGLLEVGRGRASIVSIDTGSVTLRVETALSADPPSRTVDLICALPRPQTLKKVLLTSASMGVRRIDLVRANRVEKSYFQSPLLQAENYRQYLLEGLSQGKLTRLPQVRVHERFRRFFEDDLPPVDDAAAAGSIRLLPDVGLEDSLQDAISPTAERFTVAVGPEGGWVPFEIELMESLGFRRFSMGPWVLRVETAVAAVLAQLELACRSGPPPN